MRQNGEEPKGVDKVNFQEFRKSYNGMYISIVQENEQGEWYHFQGDEDLACYVQEELSDTLQEMFQKAVGTKVKILAGHTDLIQEQWQKFTSNKSVYLKALSHNCKDMMVIDLNKISQDEWDQLQHVDEWRNKQAFEYWQKLTGNRSFAKLIEDIELKEDDAIEILSINRKQFMSWMESGAPTAVLKHLENLDTKIDAKTQEWLQFTTPERLFMGSLTRVGIPCYGNLADYHACDPTLIKELPFLALYQTFCSRLKKILDKKSIESEAVEISLEDYHDWLTHNDFSSSPGAKIAFATAVLNYKKARND